jgi:CHASE3 domain sensor protein
MGRWVVQWVNHLRIQHKVWVMLLLLCVPLGAGIAIHLYVVQQLLGLQQQKQDLTLADKQVHVLERLAVDIEDGFRGYVLTQQPAFLVPLIEAEAKLNQALSDASASLAKLPGSSNQLDSIERQLKDFLHSKQELIADIQRGRGDKALEYVRSGEGLRLSDLLRADLRTVEDRLMRHRNFLKEQADGLSQRTFVGLWITLAGVVALGWIVSRVLARSLKDPIMQLESATRRIGAQVDIAGITELLAVGRGRRTNSVNWRMPISPWLVASRRTPTRSRRSSPSAVRSTPSAPTVWTECSGVSRTERWNWSKRMSVLCSFAMIKWAAGWLKLHPANGMTA